MRKEKYQIVLFLCFVAVLVLISCDADAARTRDGTTINAPAIFTGIAGQTAKFANGLRNLAYVISGFGIIMFTFLAICGKINFKHLGYIVICLFFLSGVAELIRYVSGDNVELSGLNKGTYEDTLKANAGQLSTRRNSSL